MQVAEGGLVLGLGLVLRLAVLGPDAGLGVPVAEGEKISMPAADALLRKVWSRLERACKQENVKRYQIEASTPMTPVKEKPLTELRKAREIVKKMMKEKLEKNSEEKEDEVEEGRDLGGLPGSQAAAVMASLQESRETGTAGCIKPGEGCQVVESAAVEAIIQERQETTTTKDAAGKSTEIELDGMHLKEGTEPVGARGTPAARDVVPEEQKLEESPLKKETTPMAPGRESKEETEGEEGNYSSDEDTETAAGNKPALIKSADKTSQLGHKKNEQSGKRKSRKQKWEPPDGMRRCGQKCTGCAAKCASLGQEECASCQTNRIKETNSNACLNRGPCQNLKEQRSKDERSRQRIKTTGTRESSSKSLPRPRPEADKKTPMTTKVGQQAVVSRIDLVKEVVENIEELEKESGKRQREDGHTPEKEKRASKIAILKNPAREFMTGNKGSAGCSVTPLH